MKKIIHNIMTFLKNLLNLIKAGLRSFWNGCKNFFNFKKHFKNLKQTIKETPKKELQVRTGMIVLILCIGFGITYYSNTNAVAMETTKATNVYQNDELVMSSTNADEQKKIAQKLNTFENSNITYQKANTLLEYTNNKAAVNFVDTQAEEMVDGFEVKVGDATYYITDIDVADSLEKKIVENEITNSKAKEEYNRNDTFTPYQEGDKLITQVEIENEIQTEAKYVPKKQILKDESELIFAIMHKDATETEYTVVDGDTIDTIVEKTGMAKKDLNLNNPQLNLMLDNSAPLLSEGEVINTTPINQDIKVAMYYQTKDIKKIPYSTKVKKTSSLSSGTKKVETKGQDGEEEITYRVKSVNGKEESRNDVSRRSIKAPTTEVVLQGTGSSSSGSSGSSAANSGSTEFSGAAGSASIIWPSNSRTINVGFNGYPGHRGIDIGGAIGSSVFSATSGRVIYNQYSPYGGGNEIRIKSGSQLFIYAHLNTRAIPSVGSSVAQGQVIGYLGATGNVSGPHLHFEIHVNAGGASSANFDAGTAVDPRPYLP